MFMHKAFIPPTVRGKCKKTTQRTIIAKTFKVDEKELVIKFMSKQVAYQLADEKFAKEILVAAEQEIKYINKKKK